MSPLGGWVVLTDGFPGHMPPDGGGAGPAGRGGPRAGVEEMTRSTRPASPTLHTTCAAGVVDEQRRDAAVTAPRVAATGLRQKPGSPTGRGGRAARRPARPFERRARTAS